MFVVFAAAAVVWALLVLRASLSLRRRGAAAIIVASVVAIAVAGASIALDLRAIALGRRARTSELSIRIVRQQDWWQLRYARGGVAFTTANELHVPAGTAVSLSWSDLPVPSIEGGVCLPRDDESRCSFVASGSGQALFAALWPPLWRRLPVVVDPPERFEQWLLHEALPAPPSARGGAALFESAGCAYCHGIRGVAEKPWLVAPDLTHFAARRTIAATELPNRRGFLAGWIVQSRGLKHGSAMPDNRLDPRVLQAMLDYLESLR
jgi:cytochrome c oxidase subunit 2